MKGGGDGQKQIDQIESGNDAFVLEKTTKNQMDVRCQSSHLSERKGPDGLFNSDAGVPMRPVLEYLHRDRSLCPENERD